MHLCKKMFFSLKSLTVHFPHVSRCNLCGLIHCIIEARPRGLLLVLLQVVLVLGALEVCMVLLNGVEDNAADIARVATA